MECDSGELAVVFFLSHMVFVLSFGFSWGSKGCCRSGGLFLFWGFREGWEGLSWGCLGPVVYGSVRICGVVVYS